MAKDRLIPCKYYQNEGNCAKGREGTFHRYCQVCNRYEERRHKGGVDTTTKRQRLDKIKSKEFKRDLRY